MIISLSREELRRGVATKTGAWATPIDSQRRRSALTALACSHWRYCPQSVHLTDGQLATVREALLIPHDFHVGDPRSSTENNGEGRTAFINWGIVLAQVPVLSEHFLSGDKPRGRGWSSIQYGGSPMQYLVSLPIVFQPLSSMPKGIRLRPGFGGLVPVSVSVPTSPLPLRPRSSSLLLTAPPHRSSLSVWLTGLTQLSSPSARPYLGTLCISPRVHMLWMFSLRLCTIGTSLRASAAGSGPCRSVPLLLSCNSYSPARLQSSSTFSANGSCSSPSSRCSLSSISIHR